MASLQGSLVAIVTPMQDDGVLDLDAFRRLIDWHIKEGTDGIVVVGTTGESPTVDFDEHRLLIKAAVDHAAGRIPVVAGTGANSTSEAVELAMRYGNPSIPHAISNLRKQGCERILTVPLYPQYAASTTATVVDAVTRYMGKLRDQP